MTRRILHPRDFYHAVVLPNMLLFGSFGRDDGEHLKGGWQGVMLTLSTNDRNNTVIHVATFLRAKEDASNYTFLIEHACKYEEMRTFLQSSSTTIYCEKHKGPPAAIALLIPETPLRRRVRHPICWPNMSKLGPVSSRDVRCVACTIWLRYELVWKDFHPILSVRMPPYRSKV